MWECRLALIRAQLRLRLNASDLHRPLYAASSSGVPLKKSLLQEIEKGRNACTQETLRRVIGDRLLEESGDAHGYLVGKYVGEGDAGCVINTDMDIFSAHTSGIALAGPVAGDAVAYALETTEPLDIEMDQAAGLGHIHSAPSARQALCP